jgi:hypothetical protein
MAANEKHYTPGEVAKLWGFSIDTIRTIFRNHPGVLKHGTAETRNKRAYTSMRIPESVFQQVHAELRGAPGARKAA